MSFVDKCYKFLWDKENKLDNVYFRVLFLAPLKVDIRILNILIFNIIKYSDMLSILEVSNKAIDSFHSELTEIIEYLHY